MNRKRVISVLIDTFKKQRAAVILFVLMTIADFTIFRLYRLQFEPFLYAAVFTAFFGLLLFLICFVKELRLADSRDRMRSALFTGTVPGKPSTLAEADYHEMILLLRERVEQLASDWEKDRIDSEDCMTIWVHQIKTPISVIRMTLADRDDALNRSVLAELFRIEQYVEMLLQYSRLGSETADLVIQEYALDDLIRECIRKYAQLFLLRRLSIRYAGTEIKVVTDKKWLCCILEQLLSNAVKYTPSGSVSIKVDGNRLSISDTGIGIAPEDLPRIFEKGYTGTNGRKDMHASGLGLYLAKAAADKLAMPLTVESVPGRGTTFSLTLENKIY